VFSMAQHQTGPTGERILLLCRLGTDNAQPKRISYFSENPTQGLDMVYSNISIEASGPLDARLDARRYHLARLHALQDAGRLVLAGPHPAIVSNDPGSAGFTGSLVVAEFDSLEQAQAWADQDPYIAAGVYDQVLVKPFKRVLPA